MAEDIVFNITGDSSSAQQAVNDLISPLERLQTQLETVGGLLSVFEDMQTAVQNLTASFRGLLDAITPVTTALEDIATAIDSITTASGAFSNAMSTIDAANTATTTSVDNTTSSVDALDQSLTNVNVTAKAAGTQMSWFEQVIATANAGVDATTVSLDTFTASADAAAASTANLAATQEAAAASADANSTSEAVETTDLDALNVSLDATATSMDAVNTTAGVTDAQLQTLAANLTVLDAASLALTGNVDTFTNAMAAMGNAFTIDTTVVQDNIAALTQYIAQVTAASQAAAEEAAAVDASNASMEASQGIFSANAINLIILATAITSVGGAFLKMGTSAQDALAKVIGLADQSLALSQNSGILDGYLKQLSQDSMMYGVSLTDALNGLYYIISAGFKTADAMQVLKVSMEAASATQTDMTTVSNALTSVLAAYNLKADQASQVMDKMVAAVNAGKQTFQAFANVIGPAAAAGERLGLSFDQVAAAEATLSYVNPRIRQDAQNLASTFQTLHDKSAQIVGDAQALGGKWTQNQFDAASLIDKLKYLAKVAGGDTTTAFDALLQNATAAKTAFYLLSGGGDVYLQILAKIDASQGDLTVAFQVWENTISASVDKIKAALSIIAYQFTVIATPITKTILDGISSALQAIANNAEILSPILIGIGTFMATVLVGALIAVVGYLGGLSSPILLIATGLGLAAVGFDLISNAINGFGSSLSQAFPALNGLKFTLGEIYDYLVNKWQEAVKFAQKAWDEFVQGLQKNDFFTNIQKMVNNLIEFANIVLQQAIPNMQKLVDGPLKAFGAWLTGTGIPQLDKFLGELAKLGAQNTSTGNLTKFFGDIGKAIQDIMPYIAGFLGAIATFAAILAPWATIIGNVVGWLGRLAAGIFGTNTAFGGLIAALGAIDPLILIIAGLIALLAGGYVYLLSKSKDLRDEWKALAPAWEAVKKALAEGAKSIADAWNGAMVPALKKVWEAIQPLIPVLKLLAEAFGGALIASIGVLLVTLAAAITVIADFVAGVIKLVGALTALPLDVMKLFIDLVKAIIDQLTGAKSASKDWEQVLKDLKEVWKDVWTAIQGVWEATGGAIIHGISNWTKNIADFFQALADVLVFHSIVPDMLNKIVQLFQEFPGRVLQVIGSWVSNVIQFFEKLAQDAPQKIQQMAQNISQSIQQGLQGALQNISNFVQNSIQNFGQWAQQVLQSGEQGIGNFVQGLEQGFGKAVQNVENGIANITKPFTKLITDAEKWGADFINGFAQGIASSVSGLMSNIQSIASGIKSMLGFSVPETGPLSDADQWMPDFGDLLASGLKSQTRKIGLAAQEVAMAVSTNSSTYASIAAPSSGSEQTQVLKAILAELQKGNNGVTTATIGYPAVSTALGSINQQFNTYNNGNNAATYNAFNTLSGLAQEYTKRGSVNGLGF